ncbi:MAG: HupE/UreJ family protein [Sandarakinorhabdus sp.]|nr:HupE/UreJ family protein [Sandarakinorhabdus sp.]
MRRLLLAVLLLFGTAVHADEFKPAYLQLTELGSGRYDVLWKVPALDETTTLRIKPVFPPGTRDDDERSSSFARGAEVVRWSITVPGGLNGKTIAFPDQATTRVDILVRVARADGTEQLGRFIPGTPGFTVSASPGKFEVVQTYTLLGIQHILTGFDHLLFVLALIILVKGTRRLLWTVTAFTLAHSITLALATLGVIHVPGPPVEATIALSIVFVASEIVQQARGHQGLASKRPWLVAFSFGLLHGLGFAGALAEVGLPQNAIPLALLFFNVGVEIGQLLFITAVLLLSRTVRRLTAGRFHSALAATASAYAIGAIASYWVIERVAAFWG